MPDTVVFVSGANSTPPANTVISTEEITTLNGSVVTAQQVQRILLALRTGDGVVIDLPGDATNGLKVQGSLSLPSGASTLAEQQTQSTRLASIDSKITTVNTGAVVVSLSALPSGASTAANQVTEIAGLVSIDGHVDGIEASLSSIDSKITAVNTGAVTISSALPVGNNNIGDVDVASIAAGDNNIGNVDVVTLPSLPAGTNAIGKLAANDGVDIGDVTINNAAGAGAVYVQDGGNSLTVDGTVAATQSGNWTTNPTRPATATSSNVSDSNTNQTLLASNANRLGATIHNDSTEILYVKFGATASATSFTARLTPQGYYEVPFNYTGRIDGIWAADASGAARITELTA